MSIGILNQVKVDIDLGNYGLQADKVNGTTLDHISNLYSKLRPNPADDNIKS